MVWGWGGAPSSASASSAAYFLKLPACLPAVWPWLSKADLLLPTLLMCAPFPPAVVLPQDAASTLAPVLGNPEKGPCKSSPTCSRSFIPLAPSMDLLLLSSLPKNHSFLPALVPQYSGLRPLFLALSSLHIGFFGWPIGVTEF